MKKRKALCTMGVLCVLVIGLTVTGCPSSVGTSGAVTGLFKTTADHDSAILKTNLGGATHPRDNGFSTVAGSDNLGGTYRIPSIIKLNDGTLLAAFDIRYRGNLGGAGDVGQAQSGSDIAIARSTNMGETWMMVKAIDVANTFDGDGNTINTTIDTDVCDPCLLYDPATGKIFCFLVTGGGLMKNNWDLTDFVYYTSTDGGNTFGDRTSLKATISKNLTTELTSGAPRALLAGPGAGIVLRDGTLVVPIQYFTMNSGNGRSTVIYSRDSGATWKRSKLANDTNQYTSENTIVQLADGSIFMVCKREAGDNSYAGFILNNLEGDWKFWGNLTGGRSQMSIETVREATIQKSGIIAFCRPLTGPPRSKITVSFIKDNSLLTPTEPLEILPEDDDILIRRKEDAYFGYSSMVMASQTDLGVLYENVDGMRFQRHSLADKLVQWQ